VSDVAVAAGPLLLCSLAEQAVTASETPGPSLTLMGPARRPLREISRRGAVEEFLQVLAGTWLGLAGSARWQRALAYVLKLLPSDHLLVERRCLDPLKHAL
jgi:hypothetical protein